MAFDLYKINLEKAISEPLTILLCVQSLNKSFINATSYSTYIKGKTISSSI